MEDSFPFKGKLSTISNLRAMSFSLVFLSKVWTREWAETHGFQPAIEIPALSTNNDFTWAEPKVYAWHRHECRARKVHFATSVVQQRTQIVRSRRYEGMLPDLGLCLESLRLKFLVPVQKVDCGQTYQFIFWNNDMIVWA